MFCVNKTCFTLFLYLNFTAWFWYLEPMEFGKAGLGLVLGIVCCFSSNMELIVYWKRYKEGVSTLICLIFSEIVSNEWNVFFLAFALLTCSLWPSVPRWSRCTIWFMKVREVPFSQWGWAYIVSETFIIRSLFWPNLVKIMIKKKVETTLNK